MPVSAMIDSCVLRVGGSMPLFLSCDYVTIPIVVFPQQKELVSFSVLRMSALKYEFSVLLSMLEYQTLIYTSI